MKQILYILIGAAMLLACDKLPANGDLDGMWQIIEIQRGDSIADMRQHQVYMSIQLRLFQMDDVKVGLRYVGYFERKGNTMHFWKTSYPSAYENDKDDNREVAPEDYHYLHSFGFDSSEAFFNISHLTKDVLVLYNDSTKITYRKF